MKNYQNVASPHYPRCRWIAALTLTVVAVCSASRINNDVGANISPAAAQSNSANAPSKPAAVANDSSSRTPQASQARLLEAYGNLPLAFELNQGQTDRRVKFLSRGNGYSLFFIANEAILALKNKSEVRSQESERPLSVVSRQGQTAMDSFPALLVSPFGTTSAGLAGPWSTPLGHATDSGPRTTTDSVLRMTLVGANARAKMMGLQELPGKTNYFIGNDPKNWHVSVPNYTKVKYANVYPGVDLVYYGNQRQLEYDFVVAPGADLRQIVLEVGADGFRPSEGERPSPLHVDSGGDLVMGINGGEVIFHKPVVYQPAVHTQLITKYRAQRTRDKQFIDGNYAIKGDRVTFDVAGYDKMRPLVIDPTLSYATYLGGSRDDFGLAIAVDASGNAYVTGSTDSSIFPTTPDAFQITLGGGLEPNVFVSKLNVNGSALIYSTYLGGNGRYGDQGSGIAVDASGNAYVTGFAAPNFPTTPGAFQSTYTQGTGCSPPCPHAFITKLNATGSGLVYSTYLSGTDDFDYGSGIAVDSSGNAYVIGNTISSDFPTTPGAFQTTFGGDVDAFVTKLNAAGSSLLYSTYLGGPRFDAGRSIAVDASGNAYVTGETIGSFPTTPGAFKTTFPGGEEDAFVSKLDATGSALDYSTYLGGSGVGGYGDAGNGIAVDASGNAYVGGQTYSSDFPTTPGAFQTTYGGKEDGFVSKLNAAGSALVYSTYLGGSDLDWAFGITVDAFGNAYVTGQTYSSNFPVTADAFQTSLGYVDDFVTKVNAAGSALLYSTYLGGNSYSEGNGIAVDASGSTYVAGYTGSTNFPTTPGAFQTGNGGSYDAFISKFHFAGVPFSRFGGSLLIDPDAGVFYLNGGFSLGHGGSINPPTEPVTFSVGSYSVTLPPGSFIRYKTGYVYQKTVNHIFLGVFIKLTSSPSTYQLLVNRKGGTLTSTTSPVPVTLTIGYNSGTARMKARFD